jgi:hypothetical protein
LILIRGIPHKEKGMDRMEKVEKVKVFIELYDLVNFYYTERDQPVDPNFNFFKEVEKCCNLLDLDFETFKKEFNLKR